MRVKATRSFSGLVSMAKGDTRNLEEGPVLKDLLSCGYVEPVETLNAEQQEPEPLAEAAELQPEPAGSEEAAELQPETVGGEETPAVQETPAATPKETVKKTTKKSSRKG